MFDDHEPTRLFILYWLLNVVCDFLNVWLSQFCDTCVVIVFVTIRHNFQSMNGFVAYESNPHGNTNNLDNISVLRILICLILINICLSRWGVNCVNPKQCPVGTIQLTTIEHATLCVETIISLSLCRSIRMVLCFSAIRFISVSPSLRLSVSFFLSLSVSLFLSRSFFLLEKHVHAEKLCDHVCNGPCACTNKQHVRKQ